MNRKKLSICAALLLSAACAFAAPVPDTGQTTCYDNWGNIMNPCPSSSQSYYGQDANYTINPRSYTKLDGSGNQLPDSATSWAMVKDNVTGLIWELKSSMNQGVNYSDPHNADNTYTWYDGSIGIPGNGTTTYSTQDFINALNSANFGGNSDWRIPTFYELTYLVNYGISYPGPTIQQVYFPNCQSSWYWSSTAYASNNDYMWFVDFLTGNDTFLFNNESYYARAVRGGQSGAASYSDNGNGTVTDNSTGLVWQQGTVGDGVAMSWEDALQYCENLSLGGYTDWRLPNLNELRSLVNYSSSAPAIDMIYFPNVQASFYWSSTTSASNPDNAWFVEFGYGADDYYSKNSAEYVRAVRGGQAGALATSIIFVSPLIQNVAKDAGVTTFNVSNSAKGNMPWTAAVTSGSSWLSITSGSSGTNIGTISCSFPANMGASSRTGIIQVTATGATGSPAAVSVIQAGGVPVPTPSPVFTSCTATLDGTLALHIPYITYTDPLLGTVTLSADFSYEFNPALFIFKYLNAEILSKPSFSCAAAALSSSLLLHIPDVLLSDGITHVWADLTYVSGLFSDGNDYFVVTDYGLL